MEESTRLVELFATTCPRWSGPQHLPTVGPLVSNLPTVGPLVSARFSERPQEYVCVCVRSLLMVDPSRG